MDQLCPPHIGLEPDRFFSLQFSQLAFICSKSTMKTLEQRVKSVQS